MQNPAVIGMDEAGSTFTGAWPAPRRARVTGHDFKTDLPETAPAQAVYWQCFETA